MEMTQYQKDLVRMWDSVRTHHKGNIKCLGVSCDKCPLVGHVCGTHGTTFYAEKTIEIVTQWAKDHPLVTMKDKYKEVFGVEPKGKSGASVCPRAVGFDDVECKIGGGCEDCRNEFWQSEYKEPKKEGEES